MLQILSYYLFTAVPDPAALQRAHLAFCAAHGIQGRILIATEGINGCCSGRTQDTDAYEAWLQDQPGFAEIVFKRQPVAVRPHRHLRVRLRPYLVNLGRGTDVDPNTEGGRRLTPREWATWLATRNDYVLLDVRNAYEAQVGRFRGAAEAPYDQFHAFPQWADEIDVPKDTPILMYCTGGIRCEKFSGLLRRRGYDQVYQLDGGILAYAEEVGGEHFEGDLFVFDDRVTISIDGQPNPHAHCAACGAATSRIRNCANVDCHQLFFLCDACLVPHRGCCSQACQTAPRVRAVDPHAPLPRFDTKGRERFRAPIA